MNLFRKHMKTEWLMKQCLPVWREPLSFECGVTESIIRLERVLSVKMVAGTEVIIADKPDAVEIAKESVINKLNSYFYGDIRDSLMGLALEIQEGKDRHETVEALYKIMEDLQ